MDSESEDGDDRTEVTLNLEISQEMQVAIDEARYYDPDFLEHFTEMAILELGMQIG